MTASHVDMHPRVIRSWCTLTPRPDQLRAYTYMAGKPASHISMHRGSKDFSAITHRFGQLHA